MRRKEQNKLLSTSLSMILTACASVTAYEKTLVTLLLVRFIMNLKLISSSFTVNAIPRKNTMPTRSWRCWFIPESLLLLQKKLLLTTVNGSSKKVITPLMTFTDAWISFTNTRKAFKCGWTTESRKTMEEIPALSTMMWRIITLKQITRLTSFVKEYARSIVQIQSYRWDFSWITMHSRLLTNFFQETRTTVSLIVRTLDESKSSSTLDVSSQLPIKPWQQVITSGIPSTHQPKMVMCSVCPSAEPLRN